MQSVTKFKCSCGEESYDPNDFEFCIHCRIEMCITCATYEFIDGLDEPVCEKCKEKFND